MVFSKILAQEREYYLIVLTTEARARNDFYFDSFNIFYSSRIAQNKTDN